MNMVDGPELEAFRLEARVWLEANLPHSIRDNPGQVAAAMVDGAPQPEEVIVWRQRMGARGWGVPTWPRRYGGAGLTGSEARVLKEEMARIAAPNPVGGLGVMMFGPTLLEYGSPEQLERHIPPIARGELRWCQGFSEPGAGSDLASLQMAAVDEGDNFRVTGQKVWTTGAQYADWCFCLVRTDRGPRKHDGISFLIIDMASPGVEVRPIVLISGESPFCETFFTDVMVPKANLVGPRGGGWQVAKRLLQHERQNTSVGSSPIGLASTADIGALARSQIGVDSAGRLADLDLRHRIAVHQMEARTFGLTHARAEAEARANSGPSNTASILKNAGAKVRADRAELMIELMGHEGLFWCEETRGWLRGKAGAIAGGSTEVQNNIIAKRILGLPDAADTQGAQGGGDGSG